MFFIFVEIVFVEFFIEFNKFFILILEDLLVLLVLFRCKLLRVIFGFFWRIKMFFVLFGILDGIGLFYILVYLEGFRYLFGG